MMKTFFISFLLLLPISFTTFSQTTDEAMIKQIFDLALTKAVSDAINVPVIASGGVGNLDHLADGIQLGGADAVLAASIFHYGEYTVGQAKARMAERGIPVRL